MRTPLVATLLGLSLAAGCTVGDLGDGGGGGDDQPGGASCGDGNREGSETCDDGNTASGDGCSATCQQESNPAVDALLDRTAITTELYSTNQVMVTVASTGGFSGNVALSGRVVDASDVALPGWSVALDQSSLTLAADGTATGVATVTVPSENKGLTGTLKVDVTSAAGTQTLSSAITVQNQITFTVDVVNQACVYPTNAGNQGTPVPVSIGTKVRFANKGPIKLEVHSNNTAAFPHQGQGDGADDPITEPQGAYERTLAGTVGQRAGWYCHDRGPNMAATNPQIVIAAAPTP